MNSRRASSSAEVRSICGRSSCVGVASLAVVSKTCECAAVLNQPLGTLDVDTGHLDLSDAFKEFMTKHEVFSDFDNDIEKI